VTTTIKLPELGENVDSGELTKILVSAGETISKDQALLELETDKATIEVPSPVSGVVKELHVQEGQKIKVGDALFTVDENGAGAKQKETSQKAQPQKQEPQKERAQEPQARAEVKAEPKPERKAVSQPPKDEAQRREAKPAVRAEAPAESEREDASVEADSSDTEREASAEAEREEPVIPFRAETAEPARRPSHLAPASPAIRRLARELGIDINKVVGTGPEGRIDEEDVKNYAREIISRAPAARSAGEAFVPLPDFAKWGQIDRKPMSNVRRATAEHLALAWHNVPQVTQFDSADVTDLENLRSRLSERQDAGAAKITVTAIALKVVASALRKFPQFAASIDMPYGLIVPVIRDADQKSIPQLAKELGELSEKAREKKLSLEEMAGGVFTITNLGGIGGTGFSPIVNYPEVAILGISRLSVEPRHIEGSFQPRKILPLSLSYDHRLIDGADAARFLRWVAEALEQPALLLFRA
jgi:pyruvate dehydrogenase E2 component (dihydrolipoamide acetyltransferase)